MGGGKSPLNKDFQVLGYAFFASHSDSQTVSTNITDADFLVIMSFYKSGSINTFFSVTNTNKCVSTIGKIGDSTIVTGTASFSDKTNDNNYGMRYTWTQANTVLQESVDGLGKLGGSEAIFFCKYI